MIRFIRFSLLSSICLAFILSPVFAASPFAVYKNTAKGFALRYPGNWKITETNGGMEVSAASPPLGNAAGPFQLHARVVMEILPQEKTVDDYAQTYFEKNRPLIAHMKILKLGRQTISHTSARWWIITYRENMVDMKGFLFIVLKGKKAFSITAVGPLAQYHKYKDILADIGGSLTID
jgi:hypothetical protein